MEFTPAQFTSIIDKIVSIMKMTLEALMKSERNEYNLLEKDYSNGYRTMKVFGDKQQIDLRVPRTGEGSFYPAIFGLLKNQG